MGKSTISMAIFNSYVCLPEVSSPVKSLDRSRAPWRQAASAPWAPRGNASSWACSARNPTAPHSFPWKCLKCPKDGTNLTDAFTISPVFVTRLLLFIFLWVGKFALFWWTCLNISYIENMLKQHFCHILKNILTPQDGNFWILTQGLFNWFHGSKI